MLTLVLIILVITFIYFIIQYRYNYWQRKGVPGPKPTIFVGNVGKALLMKISATDIYTNYYKEYENEDLVGLYRTTTPVLMIRDPELIKEVTIKSFSHFADNDFHVDKKYDPLFGRNVFSLKGDKWRLVRSQITPGFSSSKMKFIHPILEDSSIKMIKFIDNKPEATNGQGYDAKELSTKLMLENVANVAFGLEGRCFEDKISPFRQLATDFFSPGGWSSFCFSLLNLIPSLATTMRLRFVTKKVEDQLIDIIDKAIKYREDSKINRNDYLNVIIQLKNSSKDQEFTNVDVAAHSSAFFFDGFETSSLVMSFALFELARNPEIQSILREEIDVAFEENEEKLPYEVAQTLPYLDAVLCETMRIYTPLPYFQKLCTKTFTFPSRNGRKSVTVEKDTPIIIPVHGLHHDSKYHDEPEVFKPERFIGENKEKIIKCTYMPLGEGPRACLGQRFGMSQIKVGVAYVVRHYEMTVNQKTKLPLEYDPLNVLTSAIGGLWLNFKKIK